MTPPVYNERVSAVLAPRKIPSGEARRIMSPALLGGRVDCYARPRGGGHSVGWSVGRPGVHLTSERFLEAARRAGPEAAAFAEAAVRFAEAVLPVVASPGGPAAKNAEARPTAADAPAAWKEEAAK